MLSAAILYAATKYCSCFWSDAAGLLVLRLRLHTAAAAAPAPAAPAAVVL